VVSTNLDVAGRSAELLIDDLSNSGILDGFD